LYLVGGVWATFSGSEESSTYLVQAERPQKWQAAA